MSRKKEASLVSRTAGNAAKYGAGLFLDAAHQRAESIAHQNPKTTARNYSAALGAATTAGVSALATPAAGAAIGGVAATGSNYALRKAAEHDKKKGQEVADELKNKATRKKKAEKAGKWVEEITQSTIDAAKSLVPSGQESKALKPKKKKKKLSHPSGLTKPPFHPPSTRPHQPPRSFATAPAMEASPAKASREQVASLTKAAMPVIPGQEGMTNATSILSTPTSIGTDLDDLMEAEMAGHGDSLDVAWLPELSTPHGSPEAVSPLLAALPQVPKRPVDTDTLPQQLNFPTVPSHIPQAKSRKPASQELKDLANLFPSVPSTQHVGRVHNRREMVKEPSGRT